MVTSTTVQYMDVHAWRRLIGSQVLRLHKSVCVCVCVCGGGGGGGGGG